MIDRDNIKRHVIVEKKSEITELRGAEQSRLADEEVLYKAIGFSLLEILGARNVLFEGWRDKSLFFATRKAFVKKHKDLVSNQDKNLSVCHAEGVKDVRNIAPIIELSGRSLSIVSDSDQAAKEHQRKHTDAQIYGDWRTYEDITGDSSFVTAEDFIRPEVVINRLAPFGKRYADLPELLPGQLDHPRGTLYVIDSWIGRVVDGEKSQILHEIKTALFDSLKVDDIAEEYVAVLKFIYGLDNAEPNEG